MENRGPQSCGPRKKRVDGHVVRWLSWNSSHGWTHPSFSLILARKSGSLLTMVTCAPSPAEDWAGLAWQLMLAKSSNRKRSCAWRGRGGSFNSQQQNHHRHHQHLTAWLQYPQAPPHLIVGAIGLLPTKGRGQARQGALAGRETGTCGRVWDDTYTEGEHTPSVTHRYAYVCTGAGNTSQPAHRPYNALRRMRRHRTTALSAIWEGSREQQVRVFRYPPIPDHTQQRQLAEGQSAT